MGRPLKYGIFNGDPIMKSFPVGASERFYNLSGKFVRMDGSGRIEICNASNVNIIGWAECGEFTASSTEGADKVDVNCNLETAYEIPAYTDGTTAVTAAVATLHVGESCDIVMVSTYYQYASIATSSVDILVVIGYVIYGSALNQQSVIVKLNLDKLVSTST